MSDDDFEAAERLYRSMGIGDRAGFGAQPAVLVVDFTYGFTDPASPIGCDMSAALVATSWLLDGARAAPRSLSSTR